MKLSHKTTLKHVYDAIDNKRKEDVRLYKLRKIQRRTICYKVTTEKDLEHFYHKCRWIMHAIIYQQKEENLKLTSFVALNSRYLKKIIGNDYKRIIDHLISKKIIVCNNVYSISNHKSYQYRFSNKYKNEKPEFYTLKEMKLVKKITKYREEEITLLKERARPLAPLISWCIESPGLKLNNVDALDYINTLHRKYDRVLAHYQITKRTKSKIKRDKIKAYKNVINDWNIKKNDFSIDDFGGRLYNSLTSIPSVLRNFVTFNNRHLVGLDIKNSQPFHFNILLRTTFWEKDSSLKEISLYKIHKPLYEEVEDVIPIIREILQVNSDDKKQQRLEILEILNRYQKIGIIKKENSIPNIFMFPKNSRTLVNKEIQTSTFSELTTNGKLYKFILTYIPVLSGFDSQIADLFSSRAKAKQSFLQMMYCNPLEKRSPAKKVFALFFELFPKEAAIMMLLKNNYYKNLPKILQRIESTMILQKVTQRVRKIDRNIPLFTIHDSILTTEENEAILKSAIDHIYKYHFGLVPEVKQIVYNEHNAFLEIKDYIQDKVKEKKLKKIVTSVHPLNKFIQGKGG